MNIVSHSDIFRSTSMLSLLFLILILAPLPSQAADGFRSGGSRSSGAWDLERMLKKAAVVLTCSHEVSQNTLQCRIGKVLKTSRRPKLAAEPGDLFPGFSLAMNPDVSCGEASIVFFKKGHKTPWRTAYVHRGKVRAFGGMTIENLIEIAVERMEE